MFKPSSPALVDHFYGEADAENGASGSQGIDPALLESVSSVAAGFLSADPREKLARKQGQLATTQAMYRSASNNLMKTVYLARIRKLKSEIATLQGIAEEQRAAVVTTQAGKGAAIFAAAASGVMLLMIGNYFRQKAKTEQALRRRS
jgi:hypothetical protein